MDAFISQLCSRLDDEKKQTLDSLVNAAVSELEVNGIFEKLSEEWLERVNADDPERAMEGRIAAARAAGSQLVLNETQLPRTDGSVARLAEVHPDPRYTSCLMLALQRSAELLLASGITKYRAITFFVYPDCKNDALQSALEALSSLYERIDFELAGAGKPAKRRGFLARLFGKRQG